MTDRIAVIGVPGGWSSETLADAFAQRTGHRLLVDMTHVVVDSERRTVIDRTSGTDLCALDAVVLKKVGVSYGPGMLDRLEILDFVASRGVPVFSRPDRVWRLVDRLTGTIELCRVGVPLPPTVMTEDPDAAVAAIRRFERAVLKPLYSTKARGMEVVDARDGGDLDRRVREFQAAGNPMLYVQKMLDLPGRDLGVAFLGGDYVGTYARVRTGNAWNTTTRFGGRYEPHEPDVELIDIARRAQTPFELEFTVVDIAETVAGPMVFEVSAFGGFRGLHEALGLDVAGMWADHVLRRIGRG